MKPVRYLLSLGVAWFAANGCSNIQAPDAMFENYLYRLANVTGFSAESSQESIQLLSYPRKRDITVPVTEIRVGLLDFVDFEECGLMHEISVRNSSLGRVQADSSRLLYEIRFFQGIKKCENQLRQSENPIDDRETAFLQRLAGIRKQKEEVLPAIYWNATFSSPEFRSFVSLATDPFQDAKDIALTELEAAFGALTGIGQKLYSDSTIISKSELEKHYFSLNAGRTGGKLLKGMQLAEFHLAKGTQILQQTAKANKLCPMGKKTQKAGYLHNVFLKFYIGEVQPYLSRLHQSGQTLLPRLDELFKAQRVSAPAAFNRYYAAMLDPHSTLGVWKKFERQIKLHTKSWQSVLDQCGLMPK